MSRLELNPSITASIPSRQFSSGGFTTPSTNQLFTPLTNQPINSSTNQPINLSPDLLSAIKELNNQLKSGIKAKATINKYGRNGLDDAITDIARFNKKVYR